MARRFKNFSIWRGRLPHWRADGELYYVTFRHRRELDDHERSALLAALLREQGRSLEHRIVCVLPATTELIFTVRSSPDGSAIELSGPIERAKRRAGAKIIKRSGERLPPFFSESFDRIIRDESELHERVACIVEAPSALSLAASFEAYEHIWIDGGSIVPTGNPACPGDVN